MCTSYEREHDMNQKGSAVLLVVIVTTCIVMILGAIMHKTNLFYQFAIHRLRYENRMSLAQGLLKYGIAWCARIEKQNCADALYKKTFPQWGPYLGDIEIQGAAGIYTINAYIRDGESKALKQTCFMMRGHNNEWVIKK